MSLDKTDKSSDPNKWFLMKLNGEVAFRILLSKKDGSAVTSNDVINIGNKDDKGLLPDRRHRHNLYPKKKQGVNFWDLGQIKIGEDWVDIPYEFDPICSITGGGNTLTTAPYTDYGTLRDMIFAVPSADWKTHFRKLNYEQAERYGLDMYRDALGTSGVEYAVAREGSRKTYAGNDIVASDWTPQGLQIGEIAPVMTLWSAGAFLPLFLGADPGFSKVTASQMYSADAVGITGLKPNADVFLMPKVSEFFGRSINPSIATQYFVGPFQTLRRQTFLGMNWTDSGYPILSNNAGGDQNAYTPADRAAIIALAKLAPPQSYGVMFDAPGSMVNDPMAYSTYPTFYSVSGSTNELMTNSSTPGTIYPFAERVHIYEGDFLGAIRQDGQMYYIWAGPALDYEVFPFERIVSMNTGDLP